jgi:hypothetical protein
MFSEAKTRPGGSHQVRLRYATEEALLLIVVIGCLLARPLLHYVGQ